MEDAQERLLRLCFQYSQWAVVFFTSKKTVDITVQETVKKTVDITVQETVNRYIPADSLVLEDIRTRLAALPDTSVMDSLDACIDSHFVNVRARLIRIEKKLE